MPKLTSNDVHVWSAALDDPTASMDACQPLLSADEQERARRFRAPQDRRRFAVARARLRLILSRYLDVHPLDVRFRLGFHGKPELDAGTADPPLVFNVSHSAEMAVYAVAERGRVGIDIERVSRTVDHSSLAERFFSDAEIASLRAVPEAERTEAFFSCWTRKEAYLKATGEGLSYPLDAFTVSIGRSRPAAMLEHGHDAEEPHRWSFEDLRISAGYVAAVAFDGGRRRLSTGQWRLDGPDD